MKVITVHVPEIYLKFLDELIKEGFYPNRAEAIRMQLRDLLIQHGKFYIQKEEKK